MKELLDRITYSTNQDGCWEVTSHKARRSGYPILRVEKKLWTAHRWVYTKINGDIPQGLIIRHTCDNKECVNPDHLIKGTHKDNFEDMRERRGIEHLKNTPDSQVKGSRCGSSKLKEYQVLEIKKLLSKNIPNKEIASKYNISKQVICDIKNGRAWSWLK